jgi:class 3 adenylate cyclase
MRTRVVLWTVIVALPLLGLWLLLWQPELDVRWQHHPAHFWLVLGSALVTGTLAFTTGEAAHHRGDARLFFISLAFLVSAGFLGLHALATPGVLLEGNNAGFVIATPIGLAIASVFCAISSFIDANAGLSPAVMRRERVLRGLTLAVIVAWAAYSLSGLSPLDEPLPNEVAMPPLIALASLSIIFYAVAAARYYPVWRVRRRALPASVITAFILLAEAMIALTFGRNWQATWWEWHLLYLVAFGIIAYTAHRQWREERFSDLYLEETRGQTREISVLFADLKGFTSFSERSDPMDVSAMLNEYFEVAVPMIASKHGGMVDKLIGDAIMVTFNTRGDQPDHAVKAVQAGLALQRETARIVERRPGWPRFRVGVNSGKAMVGLLGAEGGRGYTVIGDTVNLASRLEGQASPGQVVIGAETYRALPDGTKVEPLGGVQVKGKEAPVEAYIVVELSPDESERDERPRREDPEAGS